LTDKAESEHSSEDLWPLIQAKTMTLFLGEGLTSPIEDMNILVARHLQYCKREDTVDMMIVGIHQLLDTGMRSLDISSPSDEKMIDRLVQVWIFFYSAILPYLQGIFLPIDIDIRKLAIIAFRDIIILPLKDRLQGVFSTIQPEMHTKQSIDETVSRVLQCMSIVSSVLTDDDRQDEVDSLLETLKRTWFRTRLAGDRRGFIAGKSQLARNLGVF